jgi:peptidoglycan/LPS O-acetylase OafA/YrhL
MRARVQAPGKRSQRDSVLHDTPILHRNNFDLLRLVFAATVALVHAGELSGFAALQLINQTLSSGVAVEAFFVVSGFLIFMSFERSSSLRSYAQKRLRRIYPAYFIVVVLCAFGLLAVSTESTRGYFSTGWWQYLCANLLFLNFLQPTLPGVFEGNPLATINGALWTLKIEVMFYISVPLFVFLFRKFKPLPVIALTYLASTIYALLLSQTALRTQSEFYSNLGHQLPGQLRYFMAGAFFYYFLPHFEKNARYFLLAGAAILAVDQLHPLMLLEPFALASVVMFFGLFCYVGNFGRYGDFSYGAYIAHFPIIQLLLQSGLFAERPWLFIAAVTACTATAAVLMWHLIEKRFLPHGSHYVKVSEVTATGMTDSGVTATDVAANSR